ncbi:MAG: threonylcarbamoyl-AMP synthase [Chthonomonadetes bacterium]|nr:threonylcarbamoyl-AMP synthase [Chthonomonadetes bacterium]
MQKLAANTPEQTVHAVQRGARVLAAGGLVVFPTETVYGLAADALSEEAVRRVWEVKGRPTDKPLPVQVANVEGLRLLWREVPDRLLPLIRAFMPGALTLVYWRSALVPDIVTAGVDTVGVRIPDHPVALELLKAFGKPIVAPSANFSGDPPPSRVEQIPSALLELVDLVIDAGDTGGGVPSTVLDVTVQPARVLRAGALSTEDLRKYIDVDG